METIGPPSPPFFFLVNFEKSDPPFIKGGEGIPTIIIMKTWERIKEVLGKTKIIHNNFPKKLIANEKNILNKKKKVTKFNYFFFEKWSKTGI